MRKIFFNSSMPRSGSTLLQNILGNNPEFYCTPTSPLFEYINSIRQSYTRSLNARAQDEYLMKKSVLTSMRYAMEGFFDAQTEAPYVVDKSREWAVNHNLLSSIYPNPKIICMVRDLTDIVASMEKNYQKHIDKWEENTETIGKRVSLWMQPQRKPVGNTLVNLREVFVKGYDKKILFVRFEDLCYDPEKEMRRVHDYLEIPYYQYDYDNIKQVTFENDRVHGKYGDHTIKNKIIYVPSTAEQQLGTKICNILRKNHSWYFDYFKY